MPRKSKSKDERPAAPIPPYYTDADTEWGGYVNLRVPEENKHHYDAWVIENEVFLGQMLADEVGLGVQFGIKWVPEQQSFCCTITCRPAPHVNARCCMTTWSSTPVDALWLSLYKWVMILERDMSDYRPKTGTFIRWG